MQQISYAKTVYGQEEIDAVVKCLSESTQMGKYSREFESKIANLFNKKSCLFVNSGSSALYIGIESLNFPKKSEIITPALTFSTSVGCLIKNDLIKFLLNLNIVLSNEEKSANNQEKIKESKSEKKVGRNEKCPCGSGKKFKHCHGSV